MPQYTFTSDKEFIETTVQEIADRESRSLSKMIDILLHQAVKERNRKKKDAKNIQVSDQPANSRP